MVVLQRNRSSIKLEKISVPRPIGLPCTVSETTRNEIPARPYNLTLVSETRFLLGELLRSSKNGRKFLLRKRNMHRLYGFLTVEVLERL